MLLHATLIPMPGAPDIVHHLLSAPVKFIGDGAYSRVVAKSDFEVLKVTSCEATIKLLWHLLSLTIFGKVPLHLPQVYGALGDVAVDADGIAYQGFIVERLFEPTEYALRLRARRAMRQAGVIERDPRMATLRPLECQKLFEATKACLAEACESTYEYRYEGWVESTSLAGFVAVDSDNPMADVHSTFSLLEAFVEENRVDLDLLTHGNLKVSAAGVPVLADPVADHALCIEAPEPCSCVPTMQGFAVMELRPSRIVGGRLRYTWVTRAHAQSLDDAWDFINQTVTYYPHSLEFRTVSWRGLGHRELLDSVGVEVDLARVRPQTQHELRLPVEARHPDLRAMHLPKLVRRALRRHLTPKTTPFPKGTVSGPWRPVATFPSTACQAVS